MAHARRISSRNIQGTQLAALRTLHGLVERLHFALKMFENLFDAAPVGTFLRPDRELHRLVGRPLRSFG